MNIGTTFFDRHSQRLFCCVAAAVFARSRKITIRLAERAEIRTGNRLRNKPRALLCAGTELAANRDELCSAATAVSGKLRHLIACGHHEGGFAGLIHATEPTCVERRTAFLLFIERSILPDLHRVAAARARIAVAGNNDAFLSSPLSLQIAHL